LKRIFLIASLLIVFIFVEIINCTCLILDHLFYPTFKRISPKSPVFIIGMPRSATTLCYSFLTADSQNFSSMKLWEILFAPSIIQKKLALLIRKADVKLKSPIYECLKRFDRFFFSGIEDIHPISIFNYEEDDYIFMHVLSTLSFNFVFPKNKRIATLVNFDENLSERRKRFLMQFYCNCIRRHLFVFGDGRRYLAKGSTHTSKIRTFMQYFPGCRFIYMLRDPLYAMASTANLFISLKKLFSIEMKTEEIILQVFMLADIWYKYPLISCRHFIGKSIFVLPFNELTNNSARAVELIYFHLRLKMSPEYKKFLTHADALSKSHKTKKKYTPGDFGLNEEMIIEHYKFVYQEYLNLVHQTLN
jgi:omega-hydroxy-beta-dihydromenaquinone-9 sulfotransferase